MSQHHIMSVALARDLDAQHFVVLAHTKCSNIIGAKRTSTTAMEKDSSNFCAIKGASSEWVTQRDICSRPTDELLPIDQPTRQDNPVGMISCLAEPSGSAEFAPAARIPSY